MRQRISIMRQSVMRELNEGTLVYIYDILGVRCGMREKLESD